MDYCYLPELRFASYQWYILHIWTRYKIVYEYIALCQLRAFGVFILYYERFYLVYLTQLEFNNRRYEYVAGRLNNANSNVTESINVRFEIFMFIRTGVVLQTYWYNDGIYKIVWFFEPVK